MAGRNYRTLHVIYRNCCSLTISSTSSSSSVSPENKSEYPTKSYKDVIPMQDEGKIKFVFMLIRHASCKYLLFNELHRKYGPIFRSHLLDGCVFVSDLEAIEDIRRAEGKYPIRTHFDIWIDIRDQLGLGRGLLLSDEEDWYKLRKPTNKIFMNPRKIALSACRVQEATRDLMVRFEKRMASEESVVINKDIYSWTLENAGSVIFEKRFGALEEHQNPETVRFINDIHTMLKQTSKLAYVPPKLAKTIFFPQYQGLLKSTKRFFEFTEKRTEEKIKEMQMQPKGNENKASIMEAILQVALKAEDPIPRKELYAVLTEMLGAGVDSTANLTLFLLYEISKRPQLQQDIYDEIQKVAPNGEPPDFDILQKTMLLRSCMKETLRLYPVIPLIGSTLTNDTQVKNFILPAGFTIVNCLYSIGRNENYYQRPLEFMPQRWIRNEEGERQEKINPFASLQFGFGSRMCLGRRLAELEVHTLLFMLLQRYKLQLCGAEPIQIVERVIMAPKTEIRIKLTKRK